MTIESGKPIEATDNKPSAPAPKRPQADITSLLTKTNSQVSPWLAVSFSLFIYPGAGQVMNRRPGKGVVFSLVFTIFMGLALYYLINGALDFFAPELREGALGRNQALGLWGLNANFSAAVSWLSLSFVCYLWSALDAMLDSRHLREKENTKVPEPKQK